MENLILVQVDLSQKILKGLANFKNSPPERITQEYIETRTESLVDDWLQFRENHTNLVALGSPTFAKTIYVTDDTYDKAEESYIEYKSLLKTKLKDIFPAPQAQTAQSENVKSTNVRLPKVTIPTFSGKYEEWTSFHDLFTSLIDQNKTLDDVQRLHYLKGRLTGEAEQLVRHIPITAANYKLCWEQLVNRYSNKRYLANCVLKRFFGQRRMNTESSAVLKELLDTTTECLNALRNLNVDVSSWDIIVIHIIAFKFDQETRKQWELYVSDNDPFELPTFQQFKSFVEGRFRALECIEPKRLPSGSPSSNSPKVLLATTSSSSFVSRCEYCSEGHKLCFCKKFIDQSHKDRHNFVSQNNICFNCLGGNHLNKQCRNSTNCRICQRRHHTLLHQNQKSSDSSPSSRSPSGQENKQGSSAASSGANDPPVVSCFSTDQIVQSRQVLLPTALIKTRSRSGHGQQVRALLDQGSQASFVTEATVQMLRLKKSPIKSTVSGLGGRSPVKSKYKVKLVIESRTDPDYRVQIEAYVLKNITKYLPDKRVDTVDWMELLKLQLADPEFNKPNKIDVLLGAEVYSQILKTGVKRAPNGNVVAQCTTLGWILSGTIPNDSGSCNPPRSFSVMHAHVKEEDMEFREIAQMISAETLTEEEQRCKKDFAETASRTEDSRYVVRLPFRDPEPLCSGDSRAIAEKRSRTLERRFTKCEDLKRRNAEVIDEYISLNHMRPVKKEEQKKGTTMYLPHYADIQEIRSTTELRVVFDGKRSGDRERKKKLRKRIRVQKISTEIK